MDIDNVKRFASHMAYGAILASVAFALSFTIAYFTTRAMIADQPDRIVIIVTEGTTP